MSSRSSSARRSVASAHRIISVDGYEIFAGPGSTIPRSIKPWIQQFCGQNPWYVEIETEWAADWFNQYGISDHFEDFDDAIDLICDRRSGNTEWKNLKDSLILTIHQQATRIYGMLHARWICLPKGMGLMKVKYDAGAYGKCPRFLCRDTNMLPMGTTLSLRRHSAKLYCPQCCDIYRPPPNVTLDGAHFGPAFPHMFLFEYGQFDTSNHFKPFEMKVFGFKVHQVGGKGPHATNRHEVEVLEE
jgi:casein kinase II subunit beta